VALAVEGIISTREGGSTIAILTFAVLGLRGVVANKVTILGQKK